MKESVNISIFASGSGSNAENLILYFKNHPSISVNHIFCNKPTAFVLERAKKFDINTTVFSRHDFYETQNVIKKLNEVKTDFIVLAGFLWLIPQNFIDSFRGKIVNIHPALLPKYGGKGMYGNFVHEAVVKNKENETGITIHWVDEHYDHGDVIFQKSVKVEPLDTPEDVAAKVHQLEYEYFPGVVEEVINKKFL